MRNKVNIYDWNYIPTKQNAAFALTRYKEFRRLTNKCRWCLGPQFLHEYSSHRDKENISIVNSEEDKTSTTNNVNAQAK